MRDMLPFLAAVFIDLFSFGLMYPVIVILFRDLGAAHAYAPATLNLLLSLTFSLFPLGMFFGASLLGDLSDALGRRRTLLICMTGLGLAYTLMFLGVETRIVGFLLAGRLLSGLMAGAAPIAQAAMMDHSTPERRGHDMSRVVLVNCLALASAPAAGGVLTDLWLPLPLLVTMGLCAAVFVLIYHARFAEAAPRAALALSWRRPFTNFVLAAQHPRIRWLALAFFLFQFGFAIYYVYVIVLMGNVYRLEPSLLGLFTGTMGVGFVVGSTLGYPVLAKLIPGEARICGLSLILCGVFILLAADAGEAWQWPLVFLAAVANCAAYITLLSLISGAAAADAQGWAMGIGSAAVALAFFLSGLIANGLTVIPLPAIIALGGAIVVAAALPLWRLRQTSAA
ncbi:MFS transporter [Acidisoma silvae]|uniref:MFS transporter n=1 Tax=Acidisoma silvae TaxID=2802396 RepID=A0A963YNI6_9PROT|nr:MFS transporter [Acidisoma silvae]MCB8873774.1 MFS transporter [Acidisoma silvae]